MPKNIEVDHQYFRKIIQGKVRKELSKLIKISSFVPMRGKNGKVRIKINTPEIEIPFITYGDPEDGIGRGVGKKGDVIGKDDDGGKGNKAGQDEGVGVMVDIDMDEILDMIQEELELPDLKSKDQDILETVDVKYNSISKSGPESLRHNKRTMRAAMKREISSGNNDLITPIGQRNSIRKVIPIRDDKRYRQWTEVQEPSSNAVIIFGRDGSGSMDQEKCNIISDMAWWIEAWIRRFYKKVDVCYFWHDVTAQEVDKDKFYKYRYGGGTTCSSCLKEIALQFEERFKPNKYNIYCFYFTDGENWDNDNEVFCSLLEEKFFDTVNLFAITQILCWNYSISLKRYVDDYFKNKKINNLSTFSIGNETSPDWNTGWKASSLGESERNTEIKRAIKAHLGRKVKK